MIPTYELLHFNAPQAHLHRPYIGIISKSSELTYQLQALDLLITLSTDKRAAQEPAVELAPVRQSAMINASDWVNRTDGWQYSEW